MHHDQSQSPDRMPNASSANCSVPDLSIVIPVYRSADCLSALIRAIAEALAPLERLYEVILVNDCSPDDSWIVIEGLCQANPNIVGVDLRRNFGQDNAILTGLRLTRGRHIAIMDDDLQHDPRDLPALLFELEKGSDIVFAEFRRKRQKLWKNLGSWFTGKIAESVLAKPKGIYLSPYKVVRREVVDLICNHRGAEPYVDGLLLQVTSRITQIPVEHQPRYAGRSNYTPLKSLRVWARVAFSFSVKPLRLVTILGFTCSALGLLTGVAVICYRLLSPESFGPGTLGWASLMTTMLFLGGIQMIFFGILGEYAGRTYLRVNDQPQTAVRTIISGGNALPGITIWKTQKATPQGTSPLDSVPGSRAEEAPIWRQA